MRVFELLNQPQQPVEPGQPGQNEEDDEQGKFDAQKVDANLQQTAQDINDQQAQPDPPAGEPAPPELNDQNVKPIDAALMSQIKALPYTKKYEFDDNSPLNPIKVASMPIEDLSYLQAKVRYKMQLITMRDQVGTEEDRTMEFCNDLMRFVNTVMQFKKSGTRAQLAQYGSSPPYQQQ